MVRKNQESSAGRRSGENLSSQREAKERDRLNTTDGEGGGGGGRRSWRK